MYFFPTVFYKVKAMKSSSKDNQYSNISKDLNRKRVHQFNGHGTLLKKPNIDNTIASVENLTEQRKNLPIYYGRKELIKVVIQHDTVILMSETGSGKTTQLPQYLLEAQLARFGNNIKTVNTCLKGICYNFVHL